MSIFQRLKQQYLKYVGQPLTQQELDPSSPVLHCRRLRYPFGLGYTTISVICSDKKTSELMKRGHHVYTVPENDVKDSGTTWVTETQIDAVLKTYDGYIYHMNPFIF